MRQFDSLNLSDRPEPLRARSVIHAESKDYDSALNDLERLVSLNTGEPADYYDLGRAYFRLGSYRAASDALSRCVQAGDDAEFFYYRNAAILLRAESKVRDGDFAGAVQDCELLDSDYSAYVPGMGLCSVKDIRGRAGTG